MLRCAGVGVDAILPGAADEGACGLYAAFEIERADQRLDHVAEYVVAVGRAVVARLLAEAEVWRHADRAADRRADRPGDERVEALRECPFGRSEEHTSELQSLMRISYAVFC